MLPMSNENNQPTVFSAKRIMLPIKQRRAAYLCISTGYTFITQHTRKKGTQVALFKFELAL